MTPTLGIGMMSIRPVLRRVSTRPFGRYMISTEAQQCQTFSLPDGRKLGFAEYGQLDGKPLLFFHGFPCSRLEAMVVDEMAQECGIRILSLDRPGYGLSTMQPNRTILDWPADVQAFTEGMNLGKVAIMGGSGGGPYALACAYALPREMLAGVGLFASAPPWVAGAHHMSVTRRMMCFMAVHSPGTLRYVMKTVVDMIQRFAKTDSGAERMDAWFESIDAEAGADLALAPKTPQEKKARRELTMHLLFGEPMRQGADGAVHEAKLLSALDWGFKFEDVSYGPVWIWHGTKDANSPAVMMKYLAERLPHCNYREFQNDTHFSMIAHIKSAWGDLFSGEKTVNKTSNS